MAPNVLEFLVKIIWIERSNISETAKQEWKARVIKAAQTGQPVRCIECVMAGQRPEEIREQDLME